jgi:hypothetical protein
MMRMTGVAMMAGTIGMALHLTGLVWMFGMEAIEAAQFVQSVFQTAAATQMMQAGIPELLLGTCVQWIAAVVSALTYLLVARAVPMLFDFAMTFGAIYGALVFLIFNFVLPGWIDPAFSPPPFTSQVAQLGAQALLFGVPMAWSSKMMMRG